MTIKPGHRVLTVWGSSYRKGLASLRQLGLINPAFGSSMEDYQKFPLSPSIQILLGI